MSNNYWQGTKARRRRLLGPPRVLLRSLPKLIDDDGVVVGDTTRSISRRISKGQGQGGGRAMIPLSYNRTCLKEETKY